MKRVVSVSLGSAQRDKKVHAVFLGAEFEIERIGTGGDMARYRRLVGELDGKVDAFGVGGMDIYLYAGDRRYTFREPLSLMSGAVRTPFVDGSGLKHTLERETVRRLQDDGTVDFRDKSVLIMSAVDRFGMAAALSEHAKSIVFGDLLFGLGVPVPLHTWRGTQRLARMLLPIIVRLPFKMFYPTGEKQEKNTPKFTRYFRDADVIAGDYLLIKRYMPEDMRGKIILTNTTTQEDVAELARRGASMLVTTTPVFDGRSFGTNVMEAVLVVLMDKRPADITPADYLTKLGELEWAPRVQRLAAGAPAPADAAVG